MSESVFAALLAGRPEALALLSSLSSPAFGRFDEAEAWQKAAHAAGSMRSRGIDAALLRELEQQSNRLPPSAARTQNLQRLAQPGTTVVVTGQQVGLFGGPLYTLHKAATAIARARMITEQTGTPCVPLFWLQTEDHDYAEIAEVSIPSANGRITLRLPKDAEPSRVSLAHRVLPEQLEALFTQLHDALAGLPYAAEVLALVRAHYLPGRPIAEAFAGLLSELWQDEGLLVFDPRVPSVARLAAPWLGRMLEDHDALALALATRARALADAGCDEQVRTRPDASLVFFHPDAVAGPRYRLTRTAAGFATPHGPIALSALRELLTSQPLRFSSSALARPLIQDALLPTCAYVGGPAEVSYFAQLPPIYAQLGVPMPLVAPRARLRVIDPTTRSLLERLGVSAAQACVSREQLLARVVAGADTLSAAELRERMLAPLRSELQSLRAHSLAGLDEPIRKAQEACERAIEKLADKAQRAALERDTTAAERVDRVQLALQPAGVHQERAYGFLALAARVGPATLTRAILNAAASLDPAVRDVQP